MVLCVHFACGRLSPGQTGGEEGTVTTPSSNVTSSTSVGSVTAVAHSARLSSQSQNDPYQSLLRVMLANQLLPLGQRLVNLWLVTLDLGLQLDVLLVEGLSLMQVLSQHLDNKTEHSVMRLRLFT